MQQSTQAIGFSKADRFPKLKERDQITSYILLPSTLKTNNFNLGYGKKYYLPKYIETNASENPSPSAYLSHEELTKSPLLKYKKGPTFGLSYAYYNKNYIPGYRVQNMELNKKLPGPGKYEVDREIGDLNITHKRRINISIKAKRTDFIEEEIKKDQSPKKFYFPNTDSVTEKRFSGVSFGKGDKFDFTYSPAMKFPGPGQYELKNKVLKKKRKNIKAR